VPPGRIELPHTV